MDDPLGDPLAELLDGQAGRPLLLLDHLEQLLWLDQQAIEALARLLQRFLARKGKIVAAVDRGYIHAVEQLGAHVPALTEAWRLPLERMNRATAARVMEQTLLAGGGYMEAGLPELIAEEVTAAGPALPAALQVVGHSALLQGATSVKRYSRTGGAQALTNLHVERLVSRAGGWRARRVLAMLSENPNPRASLDLPAIAKGSGLNPEVTNAVLGALVREGLLEREEDPLSIQSEPRYRIIHPFLVQSIRDTVAPVHRGRAQARLSLRRRIHGGGVLRPDEIVRIWRYLGAAINRPEQEQVRRGTKIWLGVMAGVLALPLLLSLVIWGLLSTSSYVDTAPGLPGLQRVVVRSGRPSLSFAYNMTPTTYGEVMVDTGLLFTSLPADLQRQVQDNALEGGAEGGAESAAGLPYWLDGLTAPLSPVRRGALQILAGDRAGGSKLLQGAAAAEAGRQKATWALALLSGDTTATQGALRHCVKDKRPEVRRMAVEEARKLTFKRARAVLELAVRDRDNNIRLLAMKALRKAKSSSVLDLLQAGLRDSDPRVQREALTQLRRAARAQPVAVFEILRRVEAQPKRTVAVRGEIQQLHYTIQAQAPRKLAEHLLKVATDGKAAATRVASLKRLATIPVEQLAPDKVLPVVTKLSTHPMPELRAAAWTLQARFGDPEQVMVELTKLSYMLTPREEAALMRRAAAAGLGLVRSPKVEKDQLKLLRRLLNDPDRPTRKAAMESLVGLGSAGLRAVVKGINEGAKDVAQAALDTVCRDERPDRRVATTILATAWKIKRIDLRAQALGCAKKLVAANPRLSLWMADMARLGNPEVRRAAADAVALSASRGGPRAEHLLTYYLRQDAAIAAAVLRAMQVTPPRQTPRLFKLITAQAARSEAKVRCAAAPLVVSTAPQPALAVAALDKLLQDADPAVVKAALAAATKLKPGADVAKLDRTLAGVVAAARSKQALAALAVARKLKLKLPIQRAAMHPEPDVRAAAVELLARDADTDKTLRVLGAAQLDPEPAIRLAALRALAKQSKRLGEPAVRLLHRSIDAASPSERWAAFEALGQVRGEATTAAVRMLRALGKDRSEERRRLAMRSLGAQTGRSKEASAALLIGSRDPALDVRTEAQAALARYMGRYSSHEELWRLLSGSERDALQRHMAISALAWRGRYHGTTELEAAVARVTRGPSSIVIRMAARLALALARRADRPEEVIGWLYGW